MKLLDKIKKTIFSTSSIDTYLKVADEEILITIKKDKIVAAQLMGLDITDDLQRFDKKVLEDLLSNKIVDLSANVRDKSLDQVTRLIYQNAELIVADTLLKIEDEARKTKNLGILKRMVEKNLIASNYYFTDETSLLEESAFRKTMKEFFGRPPEPVEAPVRLTQEQILQQVPGLDESFLSQFCDDIEKVSDAVTAVATNEQAIKAEPKTIDKNFHYMNDEEKRVKGMNYEIYINSIFNNLNRFDFQIKESELRGIKLNKEDKKIDLSYIINFENKNYKLAVQCKNWDTDINIQEDYVKQFIANSKEIFKENVICILVTNREKDSKEYENYNNELIVITIPSIQNIHDTNIDDVLQIITKQIINFEKRYKNGVRKNICLKVLSNCIDEIKSIKENS